MFRFLKVALAFILIVSLVSIAVLWFTPQDSTQAHSSVHSSRPFQYSTQANGPYNVQGNTILGANGQSYLFYGIGRDGLEYNCAGDGHFDTQELSYMGSGSNGNGITYWGANTVRLPLTEGYWVNGYAPKNCLVSQYQAFVKQVVDALTALKLNVIIDLQWTDAGGQATGGGAGFAMPDKDSVTFWTQVANIYSSYSNVLFELYNEPHPNTWSCWAAPCTITNDTSYVSDCYCHQTFTYQSVGMQALVTAVRNTGAANLVLVGGMNWSYDLSQINTYTITGSNVVYDTHPYPYNGKMPGDWDAAFGNISASYPVMSAENGEYDCKTSYMSQLLSYFDAHSMSWIGWAWAVVGPPCGYPQLTLDYAGTPAPSMGTLIYKHLRRYALNRPSPGPISSTWYFAEGKVGQGFTEWLTIQNPDPIDICTVNLNYLLSGGSPISVNVNVQPNTRFTELVNRDLGVNASSPNYETVSTIVTVTNPSFCLGVVAERPMYFTNFMGVSSGSDALGATQTGTNFYFADVSTLSGYNTYITILNPPGGSAATVTATYFSGGMQLGNNTTLVQPGTRGTITPTRFYNRVAALVTSTQPVVIERPTYFSNYSFGNAHNISGAASVVGATAPSNDWHFAEGYVGSGFQENLVLANFDASPVNVTVKLEDDRGDTQTNSYGVNGLDALNLDVNAIKASQQGICVPSPCSLTNNLSAEITVSTGNIVAEREMFFSYNHQANGRTLTAMGGTDITGQPGAATAASYSFAEGYTNVGYDEWLTLQNPTGNPETISVTLVNEKGTIYTFTQFVGAHSRATVDIVAQVIKYMYHINDGYAGYEVSMTVQASTPGAVFVAERPMYWNASGTQGGSDVLGYIGG